MLVVIAEKEELKLVEKLGYNGIPVIITGVGGLNVINTLKNFDRDTEIINIGYAGSNTISIGEEVTISNVELYHPNVEYKEPTYRLSDNGTKCYTSCDFVTETDIAEPCVFDMELAFILALGFKSVKSIKIISDNLSLKQYGESIK